MFLCPATFKFPDRSTFAIFNLLTTVLRALWLVNVLSLLSRIHHIIYLVFPHWLHFKPHAVILPPVCFDGEVRWTSRLQVLRSATHKLLKKSCWASSSTNGKHSWLKIAVLCVQASLSGFGLPFSELYELHTIVVFATLCLLMTLYFRPYSPSIELLLSSNFLLFWGPYLDRPVIVLSLFSPRPASTSGIPDLLRLTMDTAYLSNVCRGHQS